jgi:hypothetical protein
MRDDQKRALLADGGKGEAVTRYDLNGEFMKPSAYGEWVRFDDTAPQAECAPREKQNVMNIPLDAAAAMADYAAPTPERADAKKDAALTDEQIEAAIEAWFDTDGKDVDDHQSRMRVAILAANKEPQP